MPKAYYLFLSFFLLSSIPVSGADNPSHGTREESLLNRVTINGFIRDAENGETLIGANVFLMGTDWGAVTNTSGYYVLRNIPAGTYTLRFSYMGYENHFEDISLGEGESLRLDIQLKPGGYTLQELVITSKREQEERQNIGRASISTELITSVPAVLQADVFRSIQLLPGVKAASDFSSGLYIRGGGPDQTLILLDRTTVYNPSHFFGLFSTFNPDAIKDVSLYKGAYPAMFGGRLGSVLDVHNKDGNRYRTGGTVSLGMLSSRAMIEGPYGGGSYMLAVRRSTMEPVLAALRASQDNIPDTFYFYDINAKVNVDHWENNLLSVAFYTGTDKVSFPFAEDANLGLFYGNRTLSINWTHLLSNHTFTNFTLTGSEYFNEPSFDLAGSTFERESTIRDLSFKADIEWIPSQSYEILGGIWGGHKVFELKDSFDENMGMEETITSTYMSTYIQQIWRPAIRWKFNTGLRASYYTNGDYFRLDPRISMEYFLTSETRLQAAFGRYHQFLSLLTSETISAFDMWLFTDDGVPPAYGDQYTAGIKNTSLTGYFLEVEAYYRNMRNLFEIDPFLSDAAGMEYADLFRFGKGYASGFEVLIQKNTGRLTGFIGYTWGLTRRNFEGFNDSRYYPPKYDRTHDLNWVSTYQMSSRWSFSAVFSYATGQAYTKPLGRTAIVNNPFDNNTPNMFTVGRVNAKRLPPYHRLDLSLSRKGTFFGIGEAEWQFQAINVYSRRNPWFYTYDFDYNPVRVSKAHMLPIIPTISYTVHF
ncbi:TonB-dependent receptor [Balneolaceae bacterium ANBcel3]|nr:TonB-dependent receptor [Balneolaceae bacterium ANBcel3]